MWVRAGAVFQEAGLCLGASLLCSQTHLPCEVLCPLSDSNLSSHIPGSSFPLTSKVEIRTQKSRQNQIYSPSCVSRGTFPAQILYRKFPLLSKNSRPLCTTLLLKIWSPASPAFGSSSFLSLGNPSLSIPLAPLQVPVGWPAATGRKFFPSSWTLLFLSVCLVGIFVLWVFNSIAFKAVLWPSPLDEASSPGIRKEPNTDGPAESGLEESPGPGSSGSEWASPIFLRTFWSCFSFCSNVGMNLLFKTLRITSMLTSKPSANLGTDQDSANSLCKYL